MLAKLYEFLTYCFHIFERLFPYITSIVLFLQNIVKDKKLSEQAALKERVNNLYLPFYKKYSIGKMFSNSLSEYPSDVQESLFELLSNNMEHMDTLAQIYYFNYHEAYLTVLAIVKNTDNAKYIHACKDYNVKFQILAHELLNEYEHAAKQLSMPKPVINYPNIPKQ